MSTDPIRVLIADDHEIVREGLTSLLRGTTRVQLVGQAKSGREAVELAQSLAPDVILLDIRMPDVDGLQAATLIKDKAPHVAVIFLTMFDDFAFLQRAIEAGAAGYVLKGIERQQLLSAIVRVHAGETIFDPALLPKLIAGSGVDRRLARGHSPTKLTRRELDVLGQIVAGKTNLEIGAALSIALETVKTHVQRILAKLGVADRTQAAVLAVTRGIVSPPDAPT